MFISLTYIDQKTNITEIEIKRQVKMLKDFKIFVNTGIFRRKMENNCFENGLNVSEIYKAQDILYQ